MDLLCGPFVQPEGLLCRPGLPCGQLESPHVEWMTVQSLAGLARLAGVAVVAVAGTGVEVLLGEIAALDFSLVAEETLGVILHKRRQCTSLFMCLFS